MDCDPTVHTAENSPYGRLSSSPHLPLAWLTLLCLLGSSCATLPNWQPRESLEQQVQVTYQLGSRGETVQVPVSHEHLTILELQRDPPDAIESFTNGVRTLQLPLGADTDTGSLHIHLRCHYRLYRQRNQHGQSLPWPTPEELFPGARQIILQHP